MKVRMRDGSGSRTYRSIKEDVDRHGNVRLYFIRAGQPKTRLRERPGTPAFDKEYRAAFEGTQYRAATTASGPKAPRVTGESPKVKRPTGRPKAGLETFRWLCEQYYASQTFAGLGVSTRKVRRGILDHICERAGTFPYADMEPKNVAKLRDEKADFPEAANARVKSIRQVYAWACLPEYGYATHNPAMTVPYLKSGNPHGFRAWTEADVEKYEKRHPLGTQARLALDLFLYTGVRRSDIVKLGPQMERDGKICFTEFKGRDKAVKVHELPILPALRASIDATPSGHLSYLVTTIGKPRVAAAFGNWFKERCREAGVEADLSAHGLRKLGATRCANNGASESQLMALFGWTTGKQAGLYTRTADRKRLENDASALLAPAQKPNEKERNINKKVPLFGEVASGGTYSAKKPLKSKTSKSGGAQGRTGTIEANPLIFRHFPGFDTPSGGILYPYFIPFSVPDWGGNFVGSHRNQSRRTSEISGTRRCKAE